MQEEFMNNCSMRTVVAGVLGLCSGSRVYLSCTAYWNSSPPT